MDLDQHCPKFAPAPLLDSAAFSDQFLAVQQAGQNYPNAMQEAAHVMAAEGCIAWGIGCSAATARFKSGGIPFRAAGDQVLGHVLLGDGCTPIRPYCGYLNPDCEGVNQPRCRATPAQ